MRLSCSLSIDDRISEPDRLCLSMVKGGERFIFRYDPLNPSEVISATNSLASRPGSGFDQSDALLIQYQLRVLSGISERYH